MYSQLNQLHDVSHMSLLVHFHSVFAVSKSKNKQKRVNRVNRKLAHNNNKSPRCILWLLIMFLSRCLCMFTVLCWDMMGLLRTNGGSLLFSWCLFISVEGLYFTSKVFLHTVKLKVYVPVSIFVSSQLSFSVVSGLMKEILQKST